MDRKQAVVERLGQAGQISTSAQLREAAEAFPRSSCDLLAEVSVLNAIFLLESHDAGLFSSGLSDFLHRCC